MIALGVIGEGCLESGEVASGGVVDVGPVRQSLGVRWGHH